MSRKKPAPKSRIAGRVIRVFTESSGEVEVSLTGRNPRTAEAVWNSLPTESKAERWGDEVYFKVPARVEEEESQDVVAVGDVAYWPPGESICIFFGPTPVSVAGEPKAYSPVNVFGKTLGDPLIFGKVRNGEKIRVERK